MPMMTTMSNQFLLFLCFLVILLCLPCSTFMMPGNFMNVDPCITCKAISEKFVEGYKKTAGSNFGGGNTDWEEKKLKGYAKSETRLIEIMENACLKSESQCSGFLEKYEDQIEEWYQSSSSNLIDDFYKWFCLDTTKVCCPEGTFGKNCRRCPYGDNGRVCSGNGNCDGDGKRTGNGRCNCHNKYRGTNCSECQNGYTKSIDKDNQVRCTDIDECHSNLILSPCVLRKCNNTDGGYECFGEPFYREAPKLGTLIALTATFLILLYNDMQALASLTSIITSLLTIAFATNLL
ncbi:unnamed protein product [Rotaria magnacalcarata]|uniref:SRCR domain-containing protein n=1 Tax=Rotaria magnacalcarata TaxID=392030 RepID=A0A815YH59_9BILA|nr:unnamed protein product [Rotaria magnacalcarata]